MISHSIKRKKIEPENLKRYNMQVSGTVQRVGFRHIVQNIARKYNITGSIENLDGYDVHIIAEGKLEDLNLFLDEIKKTEYPVCVENIIYTEENYTGEFTYFKLLWDSDDEELAERIDTIIAISSRMEKKQDIGLNKYDILISLQKETHKTSERDDKLRKKR